MHRGHVPSTRKRWFEREPQAVQLIADPDLPGVKALVDDHVVFVWLLRQVAPLGQGQDRPSFAAAWFTSGPRIRAASGRRVSDCGRQHNGGPQCGWSWPVNCLRNPTRESKPSGL